MVVRSLVWPGAITFYFQGRVISLYVGNSHKWEYGKHFFPVVTPEILGDPDDYEDGPEPNPLDAPEDEQAAEEGAGEGEEAGSGESAEEEPENY